jgi:hypothetical protein
MYIAANLKLATGVPIDTRYAVEILGTVSYTPERSSSFELTRRQSETGCLPEYFVIARIIGKKPGFFAHKS